MAFGDIGSVLDTLEYDTDFSNFNKIIKVNDSIALIFYGDSASNQKVCTVEVNAAGDITNVVKDSMSWNGAWLGYCSVCKRAADMFVCAYRGALGPPNIYGHLSTIQVGAGGLIPASPEDSATFETNHIIWSSVLYLTANVIVVAYKDEFLDGWIKTFLVTDAGAITEPAHDSFEFEPVSCFEPEICKVSNSVIAGVYADAAENGHIFTIGVDGAGNIDAAVIDTYQFQVANVREAKLIHLTGDIFVIAYKGWGPYCTLKTFEISSAGAITEPFVDSWFDNRWEGHAPSICKVSDSIVAVAYYDNVNDGQLFTIGIDGAGNIDAGILDSLEYETDIATYNEICHMQRDIYLISYQGPGSDGFVKSVDISTPLLAGPHHEMTMGMGP